MAKKSSVPESVGEVLREIGLTPDDAGWDCHGTYVLLHKALEKVAAKKGIVFDPPQIISANVAEKEAVVMVTGRMGDITEWSIGEAAQYNNKNNYPFAIAEKRAKDRVILKLVGLHGDVYSEEEADEFKESRPEGMTATVEAPMVKNTIPPEAIDVFNQAITLTPTIQGVINQWLVNLDDGLNILSLKEKEPEAYANIKAHRDQAFNHALEQVKEVKTLADQLTQGAKKDLNALKGFSEPEFKDIMALATARKKELLETEGE